MEYLICTLGTRDLQLNPALLIQNFNIKIEGNLIELKCKFKPEIVLEVYKLSMNGSEMYVPISARKGGQIIDANYELFKDAIEFPIVMPVLEELLINTAQENLTLTTVYTDQNREDNEDHEKFMKSDTLYFAEVLTKKVEENYPNLSLDEFGVFGNLINYGDMYDYFAKCSADVMIDEGNLEKIHLLIQGGIDQINMALMLRMIERYGSRVVQWQKPEGSNPIQSEFPVLFLKNLEKQKILQLAERFDYSAIKTVSSSKEVKKLARLGESFLELNYGKFKECFNDEDTRNAGVLINNLLLCEIDFKKQAMAESVLAAYSTKSALDFIWKISTLVEVLMKNEVCSFLKLPLDCNKDVFELNLRNKQNIADYISRNLNIGINQVRFEPNHYVLSLALDYLCVHNKTPKRLILKQLNDHLRPVKEFRNDIMHQAKGRAWEFLIQKGIKTEEIIKLINDLLDNNIKILTNINDKINEHYTSI